MAASRRPRLGGSVRVRTTTGAVVVVGLALLVGAIGLVVALRQALVTEVRAGAESQAGAVAAAVAAGTDPVALTSGIGEEQLVQVLDPQGRVVASTANLAGRPEPLPIPPGGHSIRVPVAGGEGDFLVVSRIAETPDGRLTVLGGGALGDVTETTGILTILLAAGLPILLILVGVTTWRVVGRALAPVDAIRAEVEEISASQLHRRVPDPGGEDEIARLARTMNQMLARLAAAQARQRRFVSDASHELRSPVASIKANAEVARAAGVGAASGPGRPGGPGGADSGSGTGEAGAEELASTVLAEIQRIERLVEDLLLLARLDEDPGQLARRPVDLDDLVFAEAARLRAVAGQNVAVDTTAVSAARVAGDTPALRRVLRNLGENAVRHAQGRVSFELVERDGTARLVVEDDGPGIPDDARERVFERFVRLDDARARDDGGTGLGLAIVAEVISASGGTVVVGDGKRLGGAAIEVVLPIAR
ncbi:MAG TPA: HAMP domain-containing sensor histidine kinase [Actinomycetes bacterium]|nr:HAMP domain-containing sensor histidine kinase [Actinomycetes bacterium]